MRKQLKTFPRLAVFFGISRQCFYDWKKAYQHYGEKGLINGKPCPQNPTLRVPPDIKEKILYLKKDLSFSSIANLLVFRALP